MPIEKVTGIFVSMSRLGNLDDEAPVEAEPVTHFPNVSDPAPAFKEFLDGLEGVEFWDFDRFNRELAAADMPELPIRLLEEAEFVWMANYGEYLEEFDGWGVLAKAVERDDWQWDGSPEPVKETLEKHLRNERSEGAGG